MLLELILSYLLITDASALWVCFFLLQLKLFRNFFLKKLIFERIGEFEKFQDQMLFNIITFNYQL